MMILDKSQLRNWLIQKATKFRVSLHEKRPHLRPFRMRFFAVVFSGYRTREEAIRVIAEGVGSDSVCPLIEEMANERC